MVVIKSRTQKYRWRDCLYKWEPTEIAMIRNIFLKSKTWKKEFIDVTSAEQDDMKNDTHKIILKGLYSGGL